MNSYWTKEEIHQLFSRITELRALIIGDVMIDSYLMGSVERISPEAPVPVVNVHKRISRLGGAANVALNIKSMGALPILCSVCGQDAKGQELLELLRAANLPLEGIIQSPDRITTTKYRIIGNNTQMLRVDEETDASLSFSDAERLLEKIKEILRIYTPQLLIFEDYDKGVLSPYLIDNVTAMANSNGIPISVDPKKRNFSAYRNVSLFKPNLKELREGTKTDISADKRTRLEEVIKELMKNQGYDMVLLTLSDLGVLMSTDTESLLIPSNVRSVADVSGAGDTVISVAALSQAAGANAAQIASLANLAGGQVCEHVGVVPVNRNELLEEALKCLTND